MTKKRLLAIAMLSGVLLSVAWIGTMALAPLMLVAFVPLLWVEDYISHNNENKEFLSSAAFCYSYLPFLLFTLTNTYWISKATPVAILVPFFEACLMALTFQVYHFTKKVSNNSVGSYFFLLLYWILFENIQFNWDLNFPWLNLGNSFANYPFLVQWYSITGMEGGSMWILLVNIFVYLWLRKKEKFTPNNLSLNIPEKRLFGKYLEGVCLLVVLLIPIVGSAYMWYSYKEENTQKATVVIAQPNLDPYTEQYELSPYEVTQRTLNLISPYMDDEVDYVLMPESAIQEYAWEDHLDKVPSIEELNKFVNRWKKAEVVAGLSSKRKLAQGEKTPAARKIRGSIDEYYEACNISVDIPRSGLIEDFQIHHKSVLTAGVEKMPFSKYLSFMEKLALDMGGTVGSLGVDKDMVIFTSKTSGKKIAPIICYESADGNYIRKFTKEGAQALFVMTNDGWWGDTPGYKQHFSFARLRAIENRRYVARSANTGISGFISPRGEILQRGKYWEEKALKQTIALQSKLTFFAANGDILTRPISFIAGLLLAYSVIIRKTKKQEKQK